MNDQYELEVLLPVHNEGLGIEKILREIDTELREKVKYRFIICEDGSKDNTKLILHNLKTVLPMILLLSDERKGYSKAVKDGMSILSAPYLLCLDSDGQCDPSDFMKFWGRKGQYDMLLGYRKVRKDPYWRRIFSGFFYIFYQMLFHVKVHDPSCPFVMVRKSIIDRISKEMGEMNQGFWWEFTARVHRRGFSINEIPINHRDRLSGKTQVYRWNKIPTIGISHFLALKKIYDQTKNR